MTKFRIYDNDRGWFAWDMNHNPRWVKTPEGAALFETYQDAFGMCLEREVVQKVKIN